MNLTPMRFRDYVWPHNPERYEILWKRRIAAYNIPYGRCCLQDLGRPCRIMRGEGVFSGSGAYEELRKLARVFARSGPGLLIHPVWQAASAYFVSLELREEPLPDYVHYSFEFWENGLPLTGLTAVTSSSASSAAVSSVSSEVYVVRQGDTLWGIAGKYGVTLKTLLANNPQISNPNLIHPGDRVKIR